jgi:hypothetical protein
VATLTAALLAMVTLSVIESATPARADPACQPGGVYVLWARGSSQGFNDVEATDFKAVVFNALNAAAPGTPRDWAELGNLDNNFSVSSAEYPAVPWTQYASGGLNLDGYGQSVQIGTDELVANLNHRYGTQAGNWVSNCSSEVAVVGGYSQGADVVGWALERTGYGSLSAEARRHIAYVALYGDPRAAVNSGWLVGCSNYPWTRGNTPCATYATSGVLGRRDPYEPSEFVHRVGSWCDSGDGICTGSFFHTGPGSHESAYRQTWILDSAPEIARAAANRLALLNPPQGNGLAGYTTPNTDSLLAGQSLVRGQYLLSSDGRFAFVFQPDGNLVIYGNRFHPVWNSGTSGLGGTRFVMQTDGNLVLYRSDGVAVWANTRAGSGGNNRLVIQDDGNLVEYNAAWQPVWYTGTNQPVPPYVPTGYNNLQVGQSLGLNQYLRANDGSHFLLLQGDSNLVLYGPGEHVLWHAGTAGSGAVRLVLQSDGNLVLYRADGVAVWSTTPQANPHDLVIQTDGNLVEYNTSGSPVWWSGTDGQI